MSAYLVLAVLFVGVWVFWMFVYPAHLHFAEQLQCFEFTWGYFVDTVSKPGGVAEYLGRFLVQFFYNGNLGPVVMAGVVTAVACAMMRVGDEFQGSGSKFQVSSFNIQVSGSKFQVSSFNIQGSGSKFQVSTILSLIPALLCMAFLVSIDAKLTMPVGMVISLYAVALTNKIRCNKIIEFVVIGLVSLVLGFAVGSVFVVYTALALVGWCLKARQSRWERGRLEEGGWQSRWERGRWEMWKMVLMAMGGFVVIYAVVIGLVSAWLPYPREVLVWGSYYNRFITVAAEYNVSTWLWTIVVGTLVMMVRYVYAEKKVWVIGSLSPSLSPIREGSFCLALGAIVYCVVLVSQQVNMDEEALLDNIYKSRNDQWDEIIEKYGNGRKPASSFEQTGYNLAMAMKDQLADRYFTMTQYGTEGLLPVYQMEYMTPLLAADAYYNMGMINTAQRFYYESMESIADHQKSAWLLKRLTMTALANGRVNLAKSYIRKLKNTLYYSDWAEKIEKYADHPEEMDKNAELHRLRYQRTKQESFFDDQNPPSYIAEMLNGEPANSVAWQYLFTMLMVEGRLDELMQTAAFYTEHFPGRVLPVHVQEALLYQWVAKTGGMNGFPWRVSKEIGERFMKFAQAAHQERSVAEPIVRREYGDTFWCYAVFKTQEQGAGRQSTDGRTGASQRSQP